MQWPNHDIQPPRNPHGSRIDRRIQRYPPPVSGNAEPSSMYAIAVNMVTTKFRPNARTSEGPVIANPGPTSRKIVVPIVGPSPIRVDATPDAFDQRLRSGGGLDRALQRWCGRGRQRRSDVLMNNRAQLDPRLEGGSVAVCPGKVFACRIVGHRGPRARQCRHRHKGDAPTSIRAELREACSIISVKRLERTYQKSIDSGKGLIRSRA